MNPNRKLWNDQQTALRRALSAADMDRAIELFLSQHAMVHAAKMSGMGLWSFADEVLEGMSESALRCVPPGMEHSVVWLLWHLARIEDMTMNVLLAGKPQVFQQGDWSARLGITQRHSGNVVMDENDAREFSQRIDVKALLQYRIAVGRSTRRAVQKLKADELKQKIDLARLQSLLEDGSVLPEAIGLLEYWGSLTKAGLLLMPPTRHNFIHLNEALRIKKKCK